MAGIATKVSEVYDFRSMALMDDDQALTQVKAAAGCAPGRFYVESDRIRLYQPFGLDWAGGHIGRAAAQLTYWAYQAMDAWRERGQ